MRFFRSLCLLLSVCAGAQAQWQILDAHTTADFRGVHYVGKGVAWVSGTDGTVLRTDDMGKTWTHCAVPPGAEKLDFRGVQAFDAKTAIVMSSGPGDQSRLYKTVDGCVSWKLLFTNLDREGFFDSFQTDSSNGVLLGDPVKGRFCTWRMNVNDDLHAVAPTGQSQARAWKGESAFAASNSALFVEDAFFTFWFGTGGPGGARIIRRTNHDFDSFGFDTFHSAAVPIGIRSDSSGVFSLAFRPSGLELQSHTNQFMTGVAVGGDYKFPERSDRIAAYSTDGGGHWVAAITQPHGYRSSVAYAQNDNVWIAVGPNGTDASVDDGRNWRALRPAVNDLSDADRNWNALGLPFVVGPKGRIGLLREGAVAGLAPEKKTPGR